MGRGQSRSRSRFCPQHNIDLSKSYFYTDSIEDRPLLEIVGNPQAVNPDDKLSQVAFENNWPIHRFEELLGTPLMNSLRTGLALGSIYPAVLKGIATGASNLSWQKGINATVASIGDLGSKMAGLEIAVKGKRKFGIVSSSRILFYPSK